MSGCPACGMRFCTKNHRKDHICASSSSKAASTPAAAKVGNPLKTPAVSAPQAEGVTAAKKEVLYCFACGYSLHWGANCSIMANDSKFTKNMKNAKSWSQLHDKQNKLVSGSTKRNK